MGPTWRDWLLLAISAAFVAMGLLIVAIEPNEAIGWLSLMFFGACLAVAIAQLVRKRRAARQWRDPALTVRIVGGQDIAVDTRGMLATSLGLVVFGAGAAALGRGLGPWFVGACALLGLLGAGALGALALGYTGRASLRFTPAALWVDTGRFRYPVLWDNIAAADLVEAHEHPWLRIGVRDLHTVLAAVEPPAAMPAAARAFGHNRGLLGADVALLPRLFRVDEVVLLRAIERYAGDPRAREELTARPGLAAEDAGSRDR